MRSVGRKSHFGLRLVMVFLLVLVFMFPIYWLAIISVKSPDEIFSFPPVWFPSSFDFHNYIILFRDGDVQSIVNSIVTAGVSTVFAMIFGTFAAYSIARYRTGGENLAIWIISQRMVPPICIAFPIFLLFVSFRIIDTYMGLILLYTSFNIPYVIWMMRGYIQDVPIELEQSALIDGLTPYQIILKVVFPMVKAGFFATGVFTFIFAWNDFLFALILTRSDVVTYPVQVTGYFGSQSTFWGKIGAMSMLGMLPMFFVVALMQKFIVRGMSMGAVKG